MCGILGLWVGDALSQTPCPPAGCWESMVEKGRSRGPDRTVESGRTADGSGWRLAFHRLAIQDLSEAGDQPFRLGGATLLCNGEIYNDAELRLRFPAEAATMRSTSDCEMLLPLWAGPARRSVGNLLDLLDGVFALALLQDGEGESRVTLARDRIGVRPLFYVHYPGVLFAFASTPGPLQVLCSGLGPGPGLGEEGVRIREVHPRTLVQFDARSGGLTVLPGPRSASFPQMVAGNQADRPLQGENGQLAAVMFSREPTSSHGHVDTLDPTKIKGDGGKTALRGLHLLRAAVRRRMVSDRPVCCLLSGGIDSSAVACLLVEALPPGRRLTTFSIGQPGSEDLRHARLVADALGTDHREVLMDPAEALGLLPDVVRDTATYDVTTVRASTPMWLLCRHIARHTDFRVVFSGEGADETSAGYLYFHSAPDDRAVEDETRRLVAGLHQYDVLRADRCMGAHGLELREPFLDRALVDWLLGEVPGAERRPRGGTEKWWIRDAMQSLVGQGLRQAAETLLSSTDRGSDDTGSVAGISGVTAGEHGGGMPGTEIGDGHPVGGPSGDETRPSLPAAVIWRRKAAFSDAVSGRDQGETEQGLRQDAGKQPDRPAQGENGQLAAATFSRVADRRHEHVEALEPTGIKGGDGHPAEGGGGKGAGTHTWFEQIQAYLGAADAVAEARVYRAWFDAFYPHYDPHRPLWLPRWQVGAPEGEPSATRLQVYSEQSAF